MKDSMLGILTTKDQLETDAITTTYVMVKEHVVGQDGVKVPPDHQKMPIIIIMKPVTGNRCDIKSPNKNYYCDGNRTCSGAGWCQGTSR
jgi:hypothetical protein